MRTALPLALFSLLLTVPAAAQDREVVERTVVDGDSVIVVRISGDRARSLEEARVRVRRHRPGGRHGDARIERDSVLRFETRDGEVHEIHSGEGGAGRVFIRRRGDGDPVRVRREVRVIRDGEEVRVLHGEPGEEGNVRVYRLREGDGAWTSEDGDVHVRIRRAEDGPEGGERRVRVLRDGEEVRILRDGDDVGVFRDREPGLDDTETVWTDEDGTEHRVVRIRRSGDDPAPEGDVRVRVLRDGNEVRVLRDGEEDDERVIRHRSVWIPGVDLEEDSEGDREVRVIREGDRVRVLRDGDEANTWVEDEGDRRVIRLRHSSDPHVERGDHVEVIRLGDGDGSFTSMNPDVAEQEIEAVLLARRARAAQGAERARLEAELDAHLAELYALRQEARRQHAERMERRAQTLRRELLDDEGGRDAYVARRRAELLRGDQD